MGCTSKDQISLHFIYYPNLLSIFQNRPITINNIFNIILVIVLKVYHVADEFISFKIIPLVPQTYAIKSIFKNLKLK